MFNNLELDSFLAFIKDIDLIPIKEKEEELCSLLNKREHNNPYHMEGNAWIHTVLVKSAIMSDFQWLYRDHNNYSELISHILAIYHDAGKVFTTNKIQSDNFNHFYGHELLSGIIIEQLLKFCPYNYVLLPVEIPFIKKVIQMHMTNPYNIKPEKRHQLILDLQKYFTYYLMLKYSDIEGMKMSDEISEEIKNNILDQKKRAKEEIIQNTTSTLNMIWSSKDGDKCIANSNINYDLNYYNTIPRDEILSYFTIHPVNKKTVIVLIGTPLSGKSTIRKELIKYFTNKKYKIDILSKDDMRYEFNNSYDIMNKETERKVSLLANTKIKEFESNDSNILISDNTNKTVKVRLSQISNFKNKEKYDIIYVYADFIPLYKKINITKIRTENIISPKVILEHQAILEHPILSQRERYIKNLSILELV